MSNFLERSICYQFLVMKHTSKKVIYLLLFPIFLFVRSELAEKVYDPCSEFSGYVLPLAKCPSEKPEDEYLECYDFRTKEAIEEGRKYGASFYISGMVACFLDILIGQALTN